MIASASFARGVIVGFPIGVLLAVVFVCVSEARRRGRR